MAVPIASAQFTISAANTSAQTISSGTGTVTSSGSITRNNSNPVVTINGTGTLDNSGTIQQQGSGRAVDSNTSGVTVTIFNRSGASILAVESDAVRVNQANASVSLTNSGTIAVSAGGQAIDWASISTGTNSLINLASGVISAVGEDAVRPGHNGTIENAGSIFATLTGGANPSGSDGIDLRTNRTVTVTNTGTISGRHGIATDGANSGPSSLILHNNAGTISALNGSGVNIDGVSTSVTATITNAAGATIKGGVLAVATSGDGDGVDVDGLLTLTNSGDILGLGAKGLGSDGGTNHVEGVSIGGGTIVNTATGRIIGSSLADDAPNGDITREGHGILVDNSSGGSAIAATEITNAGLIQGKTGYAIKIVGTFDDTITNQDGGVIRGGKPASAGSYAAVIDTGGGNDHVINAGSIVSDGGHGEVAVHLGDGDDRLTISGANATVTGGMDGGAGSNTLTFDLGAVNRSFSHAGVIANFATVEILSGTVSLAGANTYTGATHVSGGTLLANNSAGSATGTGLVTVSAGATLGGGGLIEGPVVLENGASVAPGDGVGTLTLSGGLTLVDGAVFNFQLGWSASDLLRLTGGEFSGAGEGSIVLNFFDAGGFGTGDYTLFEFSGGTHSLVISNFALGSVIAGYDYALSLDADALRVAVTASPIPEPSTYAAIFGVVALAGAAWRRVRTRRPATSNAG